MNSSVQRELLLLDTKSTPVQSTPGKTDKRPRRPPLVAQLGCLGDARPDVLDKVDHGVGIGDVREEPEEDHVSAIWRRVVSQAAAERGYTVWPDRNQCCASPLPGPGARRARSTSCRFDAMPH